MSSCDYPVLCIEEIKFLGYQLILNHLNQYLVDNAGAAVVSRAIGSEFLYRHLCKAPYNEFRNYSLQVIAQPEMEIDPE